jgi:hypothetical protein
VSHYVICGHSMDDHGPAGCDDTDRGVYFAHVTWTDLFAAFVFGLLVAIGVGCAPRVYAPSEVALVSIHSVAHGLALADNIVAPRCGVSSPAPECQRFVDAYAVMRASLIAAERTADEWRRIGGTESACHAREALRGAQGDLDAVLGVLASLHVAVPEEVSSAMRTLAEIANALAPQCGGES